VSTTLTIFFEDPFWVGVVEWLEGDQLQAARVVFGGEPSAPEVYEFVLCEYYRLDPTAALATPEALPARRRNPKRAAREAAAARQERGPSTYAQEALKLELEQRKVERRAHRRAERDAEQARRFALARQKARERHRGR
jgi:hypothetical protein